MLGPTILEKTVKEKEAIEKETADAFVKLYNLKTNSSFSIIEYSDAPDIRCKDSEGNKFNFEITLTEDHPKDIAALRGRSNHKSIESLKKHLEEVKVGRADPLERASCLQGNVAAMIASRIQAKLSKDYGPNTALVIRDSSPLYWPWDEVKDQIEATLDLKRNQFDKGIWVISYSKDKIYELLTGDRKS